MVKTDVCIIGAGPVGLFAIFELGLLKLRCHLVDYLPQVGGQLSEIYPKKPIYDIPGFPDILAGELVDNLMKQAEPFKPSFTLGERLESIERLEDGTFELETNEGSKIFSKVVVIAGGLGCFAPRKPELENLSHFEGKGVAYMILDPEKYRDKKVVIAGGGDSALDWTIFLANVASELTLVHRRTSFRGALDSVEKVKDLVAQGKVNLHLNSNINELHGDQKLEGISIIDKDKNINKIDTDYFIPLFGLSPKLGPIANWGLNIDKNAIEVDVKDYSTNVEGIYAIGDINTYPGKLKLILCGFHEAALMAQGAYKYIYPDAKLNLKYTTVNGVQAF
ncbi:MAG: NAD(P)/FAD-dependent oxidoreductase [Chitinophagales bacterium]